MKASRYFIIFFVSMGFGLSSFAAGKKSLPDSKTDRMFRKPLRIEGSRPPEKPPTPQLETNLDRAFRNLDQQKINSFYLQAERFFSYSYVPHLNEDATEKNEAYFDTILIYQLQEFDRLLAPYLREVFHLSLSWQEEKRFPYQEIAGLFDRIREPILMSTPFYYSRIRDLIDQLLDSAEKLPPDPQIFYYIVYAQNMRVAMALLGGEIQLEKSVLQARPEICHHLSSLFKKGFHFSFSSPDSAIEFLEKQLVRIEKQLLLAPFRKSFLSKHQNDRYTLFLHSVASNVWKHHSELREKYNVTFVPKWKLTCFPNISRMISRLERVSGVK